MIRTHRMALIASTLSLTLIAIPAVGQEDPVVPMPEPIEVVGVDYAFMRLPEHVPAGTTLTFSNEGTEFHEMIVVRITDETTPLEELMAMPEEETAAISEFVGYVSTFPGTTAEGAVTVTAPGRYIATCVINQGSDPTAFEALGFDPSQLEDEDFDWSTIPADVQELLAEIESAPQHQELGMITEFTVTDDMT